MMQSKAGSASSFPGPSERRSNVRTSHERSLNPSLSSGGLTRYADTDPREEGMDSTAGSGHRPTVMVGATIHPWENRAA